MKNLILSMLSVLLFGFSAQAQFLKNLKNKVEQKVEQRVTENIANKAASEADKSLNKMWETKLKNMPVPMGANKVDISEVPEVYSFDWAYQMEMQTSEGKMNMVYHLREDAPYFGINLKDAGDMFMVLDSENNLSIMYFNSGDSKFLNATKLEPEDLAEESEDFYEDFIVEEIAGKTILGYDCKGFKAENDEHIFKFYITKDAPVSFTGIQQSKDSKIPKGFNADWLKDGKGLMMEMQMDDKKDPKKSAKMICTSLENKSFSLNKKDYNSI